VKKKAKKVYYREDDFLIKIGNKIRDLRISKEMTQMELGKINFSISYLLLIAKALEVSPKKLLPD
jgi:transcriptional regulator with XRE-family HTH domain